MDDDIERFAKRIQTKYIGFEPIKAFQWGNANIIFANQIIDSYCENINFREKNKL